MCYLKDSRDAAQKIFPCEQRVCNLLITEMHLSKVHCPVRKRVDSPFCIVPLHNFWSQPSDKKETYSQ